MKTISVIAWAKRENLDPRRVYRWVKSGLLPTIKRTVVYYGVPVNINKKRIYKKSPTTLAAEKRFVRQQNKKKLATKSNKVVKKVVNRRTAKKKK